LALRSVQERYPQIFIAACRKGLIIICPFLDIVGEEYRAENHRIPVSNSLTPTRRKANF